MRPVLVTGFAPFGRVGNNPSGGLALAVHGWQEGTTTLVGVVLRVQYDAWRVVAAAVRHTQACAVLSLGVAAERPGVTVETVGRSRAGLIPDAAGRLFAPDGPDDRPLRCDVATLCADLGASPSNDAGAYACNALAWSVAGALDLPFAFVHVPLVGVSLQRLRRAALRHGVLS